MRDYVRGLVPKVRGVGVGERLSIVWPGAQTSSGYISEHTCDPLALLAALFPDRMLALVMGEVERMANDPLPMAERPRRVATLERELDQLHRMEEAGWLASAWGDSENNRRAKFYRLTASGRRQLQAETRQWETIAMAIASALKAT